MKTLSSQLKIQDITQHISTSTDAYPTTLPFDKKNRLFLQFLDIVTIDYLSLSKLLYIILRAL